MATTEDTKVNVWGWIGSLLALLVLAAVTAVVSVGYWPGWMNADTFGIMRDANLARFPDWHSAVLTLLWRQLMLLGLRSPGWVLAGQVLTLLTGLYLLLRVSLPRHLALLAATLVLVFPPVLSFAVVLGTDGWFAAAILCGFGLAARCARTRGWSQGLSAGLAVACAFLAQAARPTAAPPVLALMAALTAVLLGPRLHGWQRWLPPTAGAALATAVIGGSVLFIQTSIAHAVVQHPEQITYDEDLIAISLLEHRVLLPKELYRRQDLSWLRRYATNPDGAYTDSPLIGGDIPEPVEGRRFSLLQETWTHAIADYPVDYLNERLARARWELGVQGDVPQVAYGPPPTSFGGPIIDRELRRRLADYLTAGSRNEYLAGGWPDYAGGPLHRPWMYVLAIGLAAVAATVRRRRPTDIVLALLAWAILAYTLEVLLVSPIVTYRYVYPAIATGTVFAVVIGAELVIGLLRRRDSATARASDSDLLRQ